MTTAQTMRTVNAIAEDYVEAYAALDPYTATYAGIPGYDDKTTDLSPAMTRLLREGRLRRSKTEAGQYEYQS